ncbi:hypothetical protein H9Y04_37280 [Streptomyces sp. TRM66268-LWL]|uniref:DUF4265 domain-containing protein n=1 Tax=Streptomyces polyasparticus TaxID=2767826 RepID=A0ABR7STS9_9ACTN|nr:hypothetical protein [Streptomyces polyasparticus]MBC9718194.1 hypothetical protein [Streptomyces polyasparticus]
MTLVEELARLAATGGMGALSPGAGLADIAAAYGEPEDLGPVSRKARWPRRFGSGSVELLICRCRTLRSLTLSLVLDTVELPGPGPGQRTFDAQVTESDLISALVDAGCRWEVREYPFGQRDLWLSPGEKVRVSFAFVDRETLDDPVSGEWVLAKAGFWTLGHEVCPAE